MKKIVWIVVLVVMFCTFGVFLFVNKEKVVENLKYSINAKANSEKLSEDVTVIDVTNLDSSGIIEHEHVYKTMYDENKHWNECMVCKEKNNEVEHNYTTTWTLGYETCLYTNTYTKTCICGYSKTGHKPHVWDGKTYFVGSGYVHNKKCKVCQSYIYSEYYLNSYGNGILYEGASEICSKSDGTVMSCSNYGQCRFCKGNRTAKEHIIQCNLEKGKLYCRICEREFGTFSYNVTNNFSTPPTYILITKINLSNGATFNSNIGVQASNYYQTKNQSISNTSSTVFAVTTTVRLISSYKDIKALDARIYVNANGKKCIMCLPEIKIFPDLIEPVISNISIGEDETQDNWSKTKPIVIEGTENWCNSVKVKIVEVENEDNIVFEGASVVENNKYSISCIPELEAGLEEKRYTVIVTDACENVTNKEFTISKIDAISPKEVSKQIIDSNWAKEKSVTFSATDSGIGNVSIAFNDIEDLKLASLNENTEYLRNYKFVGDIYEPKEFSVLYKDELGNTSINTIIIDKIDNTAPTIKGASFDNNILRIQSDDIHKALGEGSGVDKYRFLTSKEKLEKPDITEENSVEVLVNKNILIPDMITTKYVYVVAEDMVRKY